MVLFELVFDCSEIVSDCAITVVEESKAKAATNNPLFIDSFIYIMIY